ncbi:MAG: hypothetical protein ABIN89_02025 [Chitinophagaceae bacterium]
MSIQIRAEDLKAIINESTYQSQGDDYERKFSYLVIKEFQNSEEFWKRFIIPLTKRIDLNVTDLHDRINSRKGIDKELVHLSAIHYSIFVKLIYAGNCIVSRHLSYFEDFYAHLGSVCDLTDDFIIQLYSITLKCKKRKIEELNKLTKELKMIF